MHGIVVDTADPDRLAGFYEGLLSTVWIHDEADWVMVGTSPNDVEPVYPRAPGHVAPMWPDSAVPQQVHLDVRVEDLDVEYERCVSWGAECRSELNDRCRTYAEPSGHPFCLVAISVNMVR
ncbi:VOC family protein [Haloglycomyces albus]|uniref:VOC family protein n=1 Tax=Haloglycomyces albus TaxID=526067 RepID=UPI0004B651E4